MKSNSTVISAFILALFFLSSIFQGCRKMSNPLDKEFDAQITKDFFKVSVSSNPEVAKVADNWSKQKGFIEQLDVFVKKNGMPVWDKSMVKLFNNAQVELRIESTPASSGVIMIPLKDPLTSDIKSYVVCSKHADSVYTYRLYNRQDLVNINANGFDSLKNATNVTLSLFSFFEKEVNGKASTFFGGNANLTIKNVSMIETTLQTNSGENLPKTESTILCGNFFTIRWVEQVIVNGNTVFQVRETLVALACVQLIGGWDPSDVGSPMPRVMDGGGGGGVYVYSGTNSEPPAAWWTYGSGYNGVYLTGTWDSYQNIYPYWANYPITTSYSETDFLIHNLIEILELQQPGQINLLRGNLNLVFPLHEYITNSPEPAEEKVRKVKEHLNYMVANQAYKTFVLNYTANDNTGKMWWQNESWLNANHSDLYSNILTLNLDVKQAYYLLNNPTISTQINQFLIANNNSEEAKIAAKITIDVAKAGVLNNTSSSLHYSIASNYLPPCCPTGPILGTQYVGHIVNRMAVLKHEGQCNYFVTCYAMAVKEVIQTGLDIIGLIPVAGEVADITNGTIYLISGDLTNAALSGAQAIPIAGWVAFGAKWARKVITLSDGTKTALNWYKRTDGFISFGKPNSSQFRKMLGLAAGDPRQAHHIIPWELELNEVVQKAAQARFPFHMQDILNGIPLTTAQHLGSHPNYSVRVTNALNAIPSKLGANYTPENVFHEIVDLTNKIKAAILANPNTPIDQIIF